jgi:hypothetical protein
MGRRLSSGVPPERWWSWLAAWPFRLETGAASASEPAEREGVCRHRRCSCQPRLPRRRASAARTDRGMKPRGLTARGDQAADRTGGRPCAAARAVAAGRGRGPRGRGGRRRSRACTRRAHARLAEPAGFDIALAELTPCAPPHPPAPVPGRDRTSPACRQRRRAYRLCRRSRRPCWRGPGRRASSGHPDLNVAPARPWPAAGCDRVAFCPLRCAPSPLDTVTSAVVSLLGCCAADTWGRMGLQAVTLA